MRGTGIGLQAQRAASECSLIREMKVEQGSKEDWHKLVASIIKKASLERLARLIKVCGFLLQTKVYLFWKNLCVSGYNF